MAVFNSPEHDIIFSMDNLRKDYSFFCITVGGNQSAPCRIAPAAI
jgi:hypothetical protein